jgi:hypothetical protein
MASCSDVSDRYNDAECTGANAIMQQRIHDIDFTVNTLTRGVPV